MSTASEAVERLLDASVVDVQPLSAGLSVVTLESDQRVVAKPSAGDGATTAEAAGLRWLATPAAGTGNPGDVAVPVVHGGDVAVPVVHGVDDEWLIIEHIPSGQATVEAAVAFGRSLAALHLRGAPAFGAPPPGGVTDAWIGLAPMRNEPTSGWPEFYVRHRVEPYVRQAVDAGSLSSADAAVIEAACEALPAVCGPPEPPARLHGDLWSGNLHFGPGGVWLIDPAAHGGHRETDLAMLHLFGAPHLAAIVDAYCDAATDMGAPLAGGWRERIAMHQLFPLLVHTVLFGAGYGGQAVSAARSVLALT